MKLYRKIMFLLVICLPLSWWSCKDYLEKTPKADISAADAFRTFNNFQGYVETMYDDIVDLVHAPISWNNGDDIIPFVSTGWIEGDYFNVISSGKTQYYNTSASRGIQKNATNSYAIWQNSWFGIRAANISLAHLKDLVEATDEQKQLIEGQAYFYRAYFHWELMKAWGKVPYVDNVFTATSDLRIPQMGLYKTAEMIIADFQKAVDLLPADWDLTETGKLTLGKNFTRPSKGLALANMAECLLYCGSPLFNGVETGNYVYNTEYCKRAANAAWKVIQIANTGKYALEPWATYKNNFYKKDNTFPLTKETIFSSPERGSGRYNTVSFSLTPYTVQTVSPTQNYTEYFETATGLPIEDPNSGYNPLNPWANRDPRFLYNFMIDGDRVLTNISDTRAFIQLYVGGRERVSNGSVTGFGWRKYWDATMNLYDNGWSQLYLNVPKIRLAEIYLIYAEAANEGFNGANGKDPGANLTAFDAVNIVRERASMPNVNAKFLVSKEAFRDRVWNERAVELAFENKRWYDLRRWHVAHLPKYKQLYELQFDKDHTYFSKVLVKTIQFAEPHYWLPFPTNQVTLYPEWKQNPGW